MGKRVLLILFIMILIAGMTACSPRLKMSPQESFGTPTLTPFLQKATFTSTSTPILAVGGAESTDNTATEVNPTETSLEGASEEPSSTPTSELDTPEPSLAPDSTQLPTSTKLPATTKPTKPPATTKPTKPPATVKPTNPPADTNTPLPPANTNTPKPPTATFTPKPPTPDECVWSGNSGYEADVIELINEERTSRGLTALTANSMLTSAARRHSLDMACTDTWSHTGSDGSTPFERIRDAGYNYSWAGENIAASSNKSFLASSVVKMWMNSEWHRKNILNPNFVHIGVGFRYAGNVNIKSYDAYYTADFGAPR